MSLMLASGGDDVKLWDMRATSGYPIVKDYNPHSSNISSLCWSHDSACVASASSIGDKIAVTYINSNTASHSYDIGKQEQRSCIAYNSASRYIMGGGTDGLIHIWDLKTQKLKKTYQGHKSPVTSLQFNWNDTVIASGSESGKIILFSIVTGIGFSPLVIPKEQAIRQIQYSHFKKTLLAAASDDGGITLWDTSGKRLMHSFDRAHKAPAMGLAFSPVNDMLMLSVGLDKKIVCYDVVGKTAVKTMIAESPLTSIDLMQDGSTLAVGSTRGKIYFYDLRQDATPVHVKNAHKSSVQALQFQKAAASSKGEVSGKPKSTPAHPLRPTSESVPDINTLNNNNLMSQQLTDVQRSASSNLATNVSSPTSFGGLMEKCEIFSPLSETFSGSDRRNQASTDDMCSPPFPASTQSVASTFTKEEQDLYNIDCPVSDHQATRSDHQINGVTPAIAINSASSSPYQYETPVRDKPRVQPSTHTKITTGTAQNQRSTSIERSPPTEGSKSEGATAQPDTAPVCTAPAEASAGLQPFHTQFIRNIIEDSLEDFREQIRQDVLNLHMEMLKQFLVLQSEVEKTVKDHSINEELLAEVVRLKEENRILKKKF